MTATLTTLASIGPSDSNLIADANGDLFGTSGADSVGSVFEIVKTASGYASTPTTLATFDFDDGFGPAGGLFADAEGDLLGMTRFGGIGEDGTVFEIAKTAGGYASTPTDLVAFNSLDGGQPQGSLIADANGDLFGTTTTGGANDDGTVFEIKKTVGGYASTVTTLVSFDGDNGNAPIVGLTADANGDLFGTTVEGGADGIGTVFEIAKTPTGYASTPTTLVNGFSSAGSLIIDSRGDLFGTTGGGENDDGTPADGRIFEIKKTAAGYASTPITLVTFDGADGTFSPASLIADANGDLFGTTPDGFTTQDFGGTVFEIKNTAAGYASAPTILVDFTSLPVGPNGEDPEAGLFADANGDLFGTNSEGSEFDPDSGTVFEVTNSGFVPGPWLATPASTSGILFQSAGGQAAIWGMDGTHVIGGGVVGANPGPSWYAIGTGDFNDDGLPDILWQNGNGQAAIWDMDGLSLIGGGVVGANPGPSWYAIGTGDFNDDSHSDILWQNANGQAAIWEMNGTNIIGGGVVGANPGPSWYAIWTGDFNDDSHSDILWQNANGQAAIWEMNGNKIIGGGTVSPNPGPSWYAIGTGDFNHDGHSDILWQNANGQVAIWEMNGNKIIGGGTVSANPGPSWEAVGTAGQAFSDILFQSTSGQTAIWQMNGTNIVGGGVVSPNPGPSWYAIGLS